MYLGNLKIHANHTCISHLICIRNEEQVLFSSFCKHKNRRHEADPEQYADEIAADIRGSRYGRLPAPLPPIE